MTNTKILAALMFLNSPLAVASSSPAERLRACVVYDQHGYSYPIIQEQGDSCFPTHQQAVNYAMENCRRNSDVPRTCRLVTCGFCR